jgi:hypothetical protein
MFWDDDISRGVHLIHPCGKHSHSFSCFYCSRYFFPSIFLRFVYLFSALVNAIRTPISHLPTAIASFIDARISLNRVQTFLEAEDIVSNGIENCTEDGL